MPEETAQETDGGRPHTNPEFIDETARRAALHVLDNNGKDPLLSIAMSLVVITDLLQQLVGNR